MIVDVLSYGPIWTLFAAISVAAVLLRAHAHESTTNRTEGTQ